jgi:deoxyadenosine/deoxycytidine kinase
LPVERIAVVGACASGKSALVNALRENGFNARAVAQEHSQVPTMWLMSNPSHLIFLDVDLENIKKRRQISWGQTYLDEENRRLANARQNADLVINTNNVHLEQVIEHAVDFLAKTLRQNEDPSTDQPAETF